MTINGTPGNDTLTGTSGDDTFNLSQGGDDTVQGLGGKDIFVFGATFDANDSVDGGTGNDVLRLNGDYSAGVTFGATTLVNVELIQLTAGNSYNLTTDDATVAAGGSLTIDGHNLGQGDSLTFDGIAEGDGHFHIIGGAGADDLTGGNGNDVFTLTAGSDNFNIDFASGRAGADTFDMGANLVAADHIDGGTGNDVVDLDGDYTGTHAISFNSVTMTNVEKLLLAGGHSYTFVMNETNVATGKTLTVDASALGASNVLNFNGNPESNGLFDIIAGAGNDRIVGGNGGNTGALFNHGDTYDLSQGGNDTVTGGGGNDTFIMGAALNTHDALDGGDGQDTLTLDGDYSAGLTLGATTIANIQQIDLADGNDYSITENNGNVAAGGKMTVSSAVSAGHSFTFNGAAETNGNFEFDLANGANTVTGGGQGDRFVGGGGADVLHGGGGNDLFFMESGFAATDQIDGGAGNDGLTLRGGGTYVFTATTITSVEELHFAPDNTVVNYDITTNDANVAAGATLQVDGRGNSNSAITFDGSAETDGHFAFLNNPQQDVFIGGALADSFDMGHRHGFSVTGGGGADTFIANKLSPFELSSGQRDTFVYNTVSDSTSTHYDSITGLQLNSSVFDTSGAGAATTGVDAAVTTGALSTATFDSDLASDVGAGQMAAHHAMLFTASAGTLSGHTFLVVDENGTAGYQAGADLVIDVTGLSGTLTTGNFS